MECKQLTESEMKKFMYGNHSWEFKVEDKDLLVVLLSIFRSAVARKDEQYIGVFGNHIADFKEGTF